MTEKKESAAAVGEVWDIGKATTVTRPDGETVEVSGGLFVLAAPGEYVTDTGETIKVK